MYRARMFGAELRSMRRAAPPRSGGPRPEPTLSTFGSALGEQARAPDNQGIPAPPESAMSSAAVRHLSPIDRLLVEAQRALETTLGDPPAARPYPAAAPDLVLAEPERRHAAGLMRINHVGELCAQGLYFGQAAVARDPATREHLLEAAQEETDHLAWCARRLRELDSRPSLFNPLWYAGSYGIGLLAGLRGDGWNLGFVVETERQVEAHLDEHLESLPAEDQRSREIIRVMKDDEARHADHAEEAGARVLPPPIPQAMATASKLMKLVAYRL